MTEPINLPDDLDAAVDSLVHSEAAKIIEQAMVETSPPMPGKSPLEVIADLLTEAEINLANFGINAEEDKHYEDPGEYDAGHEDSVRSLMELTAFYDESGPRSDPDGTYLCGDCKLRKGANACLYVTGEISLTTGSCNIFVYGIEPLGIEFELKEKFTQQEAGYAERPKAKGFGCSRCEYGGPAKAPDQDGRPSWCKEWLVHIQPTACCMKHDGPDLSLAPGDYKIYKNTICVDFDGVLHENPNNTQAKDGGVLDGAKELVDTIKDMGYSVVVLTARNSLEYPKKVLEDAGIKVDGVTNIKPPAHAYIDDRAIYWPKNEGIDLDELKKKIEALAK